MIFEYKDLTEIEEITIDEEGNEVKGMILANPQSILKIEEGLELGNPKMEIMSVFYNLKTNEFSIEVHFWEYKNRHSRTYDTINETPGSLSMEQVMRFVNNHPILSLFTLQV